MIELRKWVPHYTGIETWQTRESGGGLYIQRNRFGNKRWQFIRYAPMRRVGLYLWLGYTNYFKDSVQCWGLEFDIEIWKLALRFGLALPERWNPLWWKLNPHVKLRPRRYFAYRRSYQYPHAEVRFGWLCFGTNLPKWLNNWLNYRQDHKEQARWEEFYREFPDAIPNGPDEYYSDENEEF